MALGPEGGSIRRAYVVSMAVHALQPVILWFLFGTAFYVLVKLLGSHGRPVLMYQLSGWGFVTFIPAGVVWAVGKYYAYMGRTVRELDMREAVDLQVKWNITRGLEREVAGEPVLVGFTALGCLFVLSSVYIWTLSIDYSMSLDRKQSAAVAATPTVIYVAYVLSKVT